MARKFILPSALVIALGAALSVGGPGTDNGPAPVAATVNGEKIPAHQVDGAPAGNASAEGRRAAAQTLERVIDLELLAQEARKAALERDPRVVQAVEAARRQILAQAWLERAAAADEEESRAAVEKFYRDNPALFGQRRVYRVLEVAAVAPQEMLVEIRKAAASAGNLNEIAAWLESRQVPFNVSTASRPAEQIPLHILPRVAGMRDGQIAVFPTPRGASIVQLLRSSEMPLTERQATPVIERYLANRRRVDVALAEVRKLRGQANIEYHGEYRALRAEAASPPRTPSRGANAAVLPPAPQVGAGLH